ncbi:MAG TPA: amidohydrolase [Firmicutes bacterium]|uniref:5-methylthioadenosine/S-adenosylhomocysteine deaminase n=1 Tax=Capillibacterium thermochitinicola TaxID=2699427 RepID=A0A8J6HXA6_9FIRM|nr:amidohydrolase [Capillibacterium thermochitinicola]MBA2133107.1 amidohydrolase [Capillibacterium thermochitinicola]HHW11947.1 amidohydrolase [Bacillota bacterium]
MPTEVIHCAWLLTMAEGAEPIPDAYVKIVDDKIVEVGPWQDGVAADADVVTDARTKLVLPGLVNTHTHAAMVLFRSLGDDYPLYTWLQEKIWPLEANLTAEDVYYGTRLAINEMLCSGTTTFADQYFFMDEVAEAVAESGIRAVLSRGLLGSDAEVETKLEEAIEQAKKWKGKADGRITAMLGPHAPYTLSPAALRQIVTAARHYQLSLHIHVAETRDELEEIGKNYGKRPVAYLAEHGLFSRPVLMAHGVWLDEGEISYLAKQKVAVAHNPSSNMKLASGIAPVAQLLKAGITVSLGTDGAASNNRLDMFTEMRTASLLQKVANNDPTVLPAETALKMATIDGARALGLGDQIGSLEPGKKADLIMIDLEQNHLTPCFNPASLLVYSARGSDVAAVMVNGKWLVKEGRILAGDEEKVRTAAAECAKRLAQLQQGK